MSVTGDLKSGAAWRMLAWMSESSGFTEIIRTLTTLPALKISERSGTLVSLKVIECELRRHSRKLCCLPCFFGEDRRLDPVVKFNNQPFLCHFHDDSPRDEAYRSVAEARNDGQVGVDEALLRRQRYVVAFRVCGQNLAHR